MVVAVRRRMQGCHDSVHAMLKTTSTHWYGMSTLVSGIPGMSYAKVIFWFISSDYHDMVACRGLMMKDDFNNLGFQDTQTTSSNTPK